MVLTSFLLELESERMEAKDLSSVPGLVAAERGVDRICDKIRFEDCYPNPCNAKPHPEGGRRS